jgi:hypothetical protein
MSQRVGNPFAPFLDRNGLPLTGELFLGIEGQDPEASGQAVDAFFDSALSVAAPQPIKVVGGFPRNAGNPALVYVAENTFSMRTRDEDGGEVFYAANAAVDSDQFQPLDSDLTAIAALSTTTFGRSLLTLANAAAGRTALGIVDSLPLTGGTMTGSILRSSAGAHPYMADSDYTTARIFVTDNGATDPRTQAGDIWLEKEP